MVTFRAAVLTTSMLLAASAGLAIAQTSPRGGRAGTAAHTAADAAQVASLKPAFETLLAADHDYQGHRIKAVRDIAAACRLLGTDILPADFEERIKAHKQAGAATKPATRAATRPGKPEPEVQSTSDTQLKQAQATVQQVLSAIPAGQQPRVTERLQDAIAELNTALSIR